MKDWLKIDFPTLRRLVLLKPFLKRAFIFVSLFTVIFIWSDSSRNLSEDESFIIALGLSIIVSFIWRRIVRKFNL